MIERLHEAAYTEHPVFQSPERDASLWRYLDFARFVALLERRALFFSSIRNFPDPYEGALSLKLLAELQAEGGEQVRQARLWNLASYVSCWNEEAHESVALWSMYTSQSQGVAIRSSVATMVKGLELLPQGPSPDELYVGRVQYVDHQTADIPPDNKFWPLLHKRTAYEFEHEVRVVVWPRRLINAASSINPREWWEALPDIAPPGYEIGIDPGVFIEAVVVAPQAQDWFVDLVKAVSLRHGVTAPVGRSDLDVPPP